MNARHAKTFQEPTRTKCQCVLGSDTHVMKWHRMLMSVKVFQRVLVNIEQCQGVIGKHKRELGQN